MLRVHFRAFSSAPWVCVSTSCWYLHSLNYCSFPFIGEPHMSVREHHRRKTLVALGWGHANPLWLTASKVALISSSCLLSWVFYLNIAWWEEMNPTKSCSKKALRGSSLVIRTLSFTESAEVELKIGFYCFFFFNPARDGRQDLVRGGQGLQKWIILSPSNVFVMFSITP